MKPVKRLIHAIVPRSLVNVVWNAASDLKDLPARLRDPRPAPWRSVHNVGGGDFHGTGARLFELIKAEAGLEPDSAVLDIGCGAGRLALPLCASLGPDGSYTGFDIAPRALAFARKHVTCVCAVRFVHAGVANREYVSAGGSGDSYRFPAEDGSIDLAVATSLFTHLDAATARAYLRETGRVLKTGGRLYATAFEVRPQDVTALEQGLCRLALQPMDGGAWAADPKHPERAIGFETGVLERWAREAGLVRVKTIASGDWRERAPSGEFQDHILFIKEVGRGEGH